MTTVAYKQGVLAVDRQGTDSGLISRCSFKAKQVGDNVYAGAGGFAESLKIIQWIEAGGHAQEDIPVPEFEKTEVIQMNMKTGKVTIWEDDMPFPCEDPMYAWGSGSHLAIGAMAAGATPREAIEVASKWDCYTGLGVQYFESIPARKRRERKKIQDIRVST